MSSKSIQLEPELVKSTHQKDWLYIFSISACIALALYWLLVIHRYVPPLPIYDEWYTLQPLSEGGVIDSLWRSQNEQKSVIGALSVFLAHWLGYWRLPYLGVLSILVFSLFIISRLKSLRGYTVLSDFMLPLVCFHSSLAFSYFRPDMACFPFLMGTASLTACLLLISEARKPAFVSDIIIGIGIVLLSINTSTGVVYATFFGAIFFFLRAYRWLYSGGNILIAFISNIIAAMLCILYVYTMNITDFTMAGIKTSSTWDKLICFLTGVAASFGELGILLGSILGVVILIALALLCLSLYNLYVTKVLSGGYLFCAIGLIVTGLISPLIIGVARGGWSCVAPRHLFILLQLPIIVLLILSVQYHVLSKSTRLFFHVFCFLFVLSFIYSIPILSDLHGYKKLELYWKMQEDINQGLPVEIIASRNGYGISMDSARIFTDNINKFKHLNIRPFNQISDFHYSSKEYLPITNEYLIPHQMEAITSEPGSFQGCEGNGARLEFKLPTTTYIKAVKIVFTIQADFLETESVANCATSCFSTDIKGNIISDEQKCLMNLNNIENDCWVWVNTDIERFYFKPCLDNFKFNIKSVEIYK